MSDDHRGVIAYIDSDAVAYFSIGFAVVMFGMFALIGLETLLETVIIPFVAAHIPTGFKQLSPRQQLLLNFFSTGSVFLAIGVGRILQLRRRGSATQRSEADRDE